MEYSGLGTQVLKMCSCGGEACSCWAEEQHSPWAVAGEVRPPAAAAAVSSGVEVPCGVCICVGLGDPAELRQRGLCWTLLCWGFLWEEAPWVSRGAAVASAGGLTETWGDGCLPVFLTCLTKCLSAVGWTGEGTETASLQKEELNFFFLKGYKIFPDLKLGLLWKSLFWLWECLSGANWQQLKWVSLSDNHKYLLQFL